MYVAYPRCPTCQISMVRCKRYFSLINKIQKSIADISAAVATLTGSQRQSLPLRSSISLEGVKLPDQIIDIIQRKDLNNRHERLVELFVHVIKLFQELNCRMDIERDKLLKLLYEHVEKNNSVYLTRQQWLDLENEYNRLVFIDHFRTMKESTAYGLNQSETVTLETILFGPNPFTKFACKISYLLLNQETGDHDKWKLTASEDDSEWKSILLDGKSWDDFEKDRLMCDRKWIICPKGKQTHYTQGEACMT
jgi:hypothetical protein